MKTGIVERTIENLRTGKMPPSRLAANLPISSKLSAEWQNGLETISGYPQRKLRLVLANFGLAA